MVVAVLAPAERLSLAAAAACEAAARAGAASWEVVVGDGQARLDGLAWLHPRVALRRSPDPLALAVTHAANGGSVAPDEPFRERLASAGAGIVPACTLVGPDGAPLWRRSDPDVPALRDAGYEPEGVRGLVAPASSGSAVRVLSREALGRANREAILALSPDERLHRLDAALRAAGLVLDPARLERAWRALAPKLRRLTDAPDHLAFLRGDWRRPPVRVAPPWTDDVLRPDVLSDPDAFVDALDPDPRARPHVRRLLRWALTGQSVAPRLDDVWGLLGPAEVGRRLERSAPGGS